MKDKYLKYKKIIKSLLGLGTTIGLIGVFCLFSNIIILGIIITIIGIIILIITRLLKIKTIKIEEEGKKNCLICNDPTELVIENRYYVGDNLVDEDTFNNYKSEKKRFEIYYYKCSKCNYCLTYIKSYLIINNKEKPLNDKLSIDFDYQGDY